MPGATHFSCRTLTEPSENPLLFHQETEIGVQHLATAHIGSVLVQRSRKWDTDHKQIQIRVSTPEMVV